MPRRPTARSRNDLRGAFLGLGLAALAAPLPAEPVTEILNACSQDIERFCSTVTPGGGRLLACIAAHQDQVTRDCLALLYDRTTDLSAFANTISFVATACGPEIDAHCGDVEPGEGRITRCLADPDVPVTPSCRGALQGIGLRE
jgi:hypothetical protein